MPKRELNLEVILQNFVSQMEQLFGDELRSVTLYGSAAGVDYNPERSDLNFLVIVKEIQSEKFQPMLRWVKGWRQRQIAVPLLLDLNLLESSVAHFPIEFSEMREQHETLYGEDPLKQLEIPLQYLKLQCEQELKGKRLRLPAAYVETQGEPLALEALLIAAVKSFGVLMRTLLKLKKISPAREFLEILDQIEHAFGLELEGVRQAHQLRMGFQHFDRDELDKLFHHLFYDVNQLALKAEAFFRE